MPNNHERKKFLFNTFKNCGTVLRIESYYNLSQDKAGAVRAKIESWHEIMTWEKQRFIIIFIIMTWRKQ